MRRAIEHKRDGNALEAPVWEEITRAFLDGSVEDAQMAALMMAVVWRGMTIDETAALTNAMVQSGATLHYSGGKPVVDKHSSGGVSDVVSLVAVPVVAACRVRVAKLSGRALGHTGGTIDKLETIPGFNVAPSMEAFVAQVERVGCAIAAQSDAIVPADKRLYRLRDLTATIAQTGLIAASIVSKKIAGGAGAFVFDVKCGSAAFMRDPGQALELARTLIELSQRFGRKARAIISDMNEPLGRSIGTALEVIEARDILRAGTADDRSLEGVLQIAEAMLQLAGVQKPRDSARRALESGAAYEKFIEMVVAQGSSRDALETMHASPEGHRAIASSAGFVAAIDAVRLGNLARAMTRSEPSAGIVVQVRTGQSVSLGDTLAVVHGTHSPPHELEAAFSISTRAPKPRALLYASL